MLAATLPPRGMWALLIGYGPKTFPRNISYRNVKKTETKNNPEAELLSSVATL